MIAVSVQAGTASARPDGSGSAPAAGTMAVKADPGALPVKLSPAQHTALLRDAEAATGSTSRTLGLGAKEKLVVRDVVKDVDGTTHTRYERTYAGLPVLGGDLVIDRAKSGTVRSITKSTKARVKVPTTSATVKAATAEKAAVNAAKAQGSKKTAADRAPRKVIWAANGTPMLAYETVVGGLQEDGTPNELHVITDATTGKKLYQYQAVQNGTGNSQYSGQVTLGTSGSSGSYNMTDGGRGGHKTYNLNRGTSGTGTLYTDADDVWGNGTNSDAATAGVDAHYGAAETWDYYKNVHGRSGIRGDGVGAYSRVHYSTGYVNAFWQDSCFCMTYGDGQGSAKPLTSIDVAAHEMTHGVTAATAKLVYSGESGGLNEGTSDIFAAAVEFYANNTKDPGDYLVGEKIDINGDGTPLRYMDKPSKDGASKDSWYSGVGNVDVHYSSGIANHFFYLLSEGSGAKEINGVKYDSPTYDNVPVTGIGRENAEKVWFKALSQRMTSNTNYAGARDATLWAAGELFGQGSAQYNAVANAWAGVNVGTRIADGVSVTGPGDQTSIVGQPVSLQIKASSSNTGALTYAATGLPAGLSINSSSGLISGTPTATGASAVTVTVTDSKSKSGTASFTWTVNTTGGSVFENTTHVAIPDAGAAVTSPITVSRPGNAPSGLKVGVDISHTYRGDLVIDLVAPDGTAYRLKDSSLFDSAADVKTTYTVDASSETASGTWKLKVQDVYGQDTGTINSWKLTF
ncbi:M4 family metallopeptidase [Streptomyces sp. NPDC048636]|uniref:M4 family metallopeptidase n=1 Tax=Streptomyces sp. NPDC048636 TaxID=3155762 RepID=UPI00341300F2